MKDPRKRRWIVVGAAAIALVTLSTTSVFATHLFTDVPSSAFYHEHVTAIFNAGVTVGCGGAKYCPNSAVTRGQMAVFLSKIGGLRLGSGGIPRTVVDALTDQGVLVLRFFLAPAFLTAPVETSVCSNTLTLPFPATFGEYSLKFQLYDVEESGGDPAMDTAKLNIGLRDTASDGYQICFATTDDSALSRGAYKLFGTMTVNLGQGLFGSGAGASKARDAATRLRSAAR